MPPRRQHPAKGWAAALDRTSLVRTDIQQDSSENQQRLNRQTARAFGLKLKPGYDFSEPGKSASKPITRRELERGINAIVKEKAVEALLVSSVDRLSRLGMRHVGEMLDAVDAVGAGSSSTRATWTAPSRQAGPSSRSSPSRPRTRQALSRGGSRPGVRAAASRASGPASAPMDIWSSMGSWFRTLTRRRSFGGLWSRSWKGWDLVRLQWR